MNSSQIIISLIIGVAVIIAFNDRSRQEEKLKTQRLKRGQKTALIEPLLLPIILAALVIIMLIHETSMSATITAKFVLLFFYISIYYTILLLLLPLLRRIISARACAAMWMLPALLYFTIYTSGYEANPLFIITIPHQWLTVFAWIWAVGFSSIMIWQLLSHLTYRRFLLKNSIEVTDANILSLWHNESIKHGVKVQIPIFISEIVSTPLTIGCFDRSMRLILPIQNYTDEELDLIFRHELRHILRADTRTKLFIGFCTAVCWFNPLAWIARRKAADDLELSCDEAVLSGAHETSRRQYADLLLKSAGNSRGYTTCLSGAASTLRYRLRNIVNPRKRISGGIFIGVAMFGLIMVMGTIALADSSNTVQSVIFDKAPPDLVVDGVSTYKWNDELFAYSFVYGWDEEKLSEYLASLRVKQVYAGNYTDKKTRSLYVDYGEIIDGETVSLTQFEVSDGLLFANIPYDNSGEITFILEDEIDWDYVETLLDFDAQNPDPSPFPPNMMMYFDDKVNADDELMHASKTVLSIKRNGVDQKVNENLIDQGIGGIHGFPATEVILYFSYEPEGFYEVKVENWDRTSSYTVLSSDLEDDVLPLAPYSAHYTVYGTFKTVRATTYEMSFAFDVVLPE